MDESDDISIEDLATILDDAAIDFEIDDDNDIYVTAAEFNLWVRLPERQFIVFTTYWKFRPKVPAVKALELANRCNATMIPMCQFHVNDDVTRLNGAFGLDVRYGLNRRQFLRDMRQFSRIFSTAIKNEDTEMLLTPRGADTTPDNMLN